MADIQPEGYLALPPKNHYPPFLVLHAWWGLNQDVRKFCDRLAEEGFPVFAPDLYHGKLADTVPEAEAFGSQLDSQVDQALKEIGQAAAWLSENYGQQQGLAVIAFSLGAWYALEQSNADPIHIRKVVVFYGSRAGDYSSSKAEYLGHYAQDDPYEPGANVKAMLGTMQEAGRPVTIYTYPATGHWFFEPSRPEAYDEPAAQLAWERTLKFLKA